MQTSNAGPTIITRKRLIKNSFEHLDLTQLIKKKTSKSREQLAFLIGDGCTFIVVLNTIHNNYVPCYLIYFQMSS